MTEQLESQRLFNHAALSYLKIWEQTDHQILSKIELGLQHSDLDKIAEAVYQIAKKYKVVRGISSKDAQKKELSQHKKKQRWKQISQIIQTTAKENIDNHLLVSALSKRLEMFSSQKSAHSQEAHSLISFSSKLLWFFPNTDVKIYDSLAANALKKEMGYKRKDGYKGYENCWIAGFNKHKKELDSAIRNLPKLLDWSPVPYSLHDEAHHAISTHWFKERVFDQYLWSIGPSDTQK